MCLKIFFFGDDLNLLLNGYNEATNSFVLKYIPSTLRSTGMDTGMGMIQVHKDTTFLEKPKV